MERKHPNVGFGAERSRTPTEFLLDPHVIEKGITIAAAARDSGNTHRTTTLRPGLVLGKITDSGKYAQYDPSAVDGTEVAACILKDQVRVVDEDGNAVDASAIGVVHGRVDESALIGCDAAAKADLVAILFD